MPVTRLEVSCTRRPVDTAEAESVLARLDHEAGAYFGCDSGIAGLHPLQASLVVDPALVFEVFEDGLKVSAPRACGQALLRHPALAGFVALAGRGGGPGPLPALRAFLEAFKPRPEALLLGALRFEAHRLNRSTPGSPSTQNPLGLLFFSERHWQRDAQGQWHEIWLRWPGQQVVASPAAAPVPTAAAWAGTDPADDFPEGGYAEVVGKALEHLRNRPLVSLTLSQCFRRRADISPAAAFANLRRVNPAPASFFLHVPGAERLFGASPDLQLVVENGAVTSLPVCGTVARGSGAIGEAESLRELINEEVDAASLAVCSDALRNDLAPLCEPGSLRLVDRRRPMSLATVVHTVDRIRGRLRAGADAWDAIVATAAPVMVTGTPRAQALRSIAELEASPRGWYGGLMVRVGADGSALVGTMLRAAVLQGGVAEVRTGGDLLADSDPPREERESRHKALSLWRALGVAAAPPGAVRHTQEPADTGTLCLHDLGDPFAAALRDVVMALGWRHQSGATATLLHGNDVAACRGWLAARHPSLASQTIAFGDAAACLLESAGLAVREIAPEQGRLLRCTPTAQAPWPAAQPFFVGRYARLLLDQQAPPAGWQIWAVDADGRPVALAHAERRLACLMWRPDSLLCDDQARGVLQAALRFVGSR